MEDTNQGNGTIPGGDRARADLIRGERMDAASRTAGALAHQLSNYLGTIRTMLELLAERVDQEPDAAQDFGILSQTVEGAMQLVKALRAFAHPRPLGIATTDVNAALREAEPALRVLLGDGASLDVRLAPGALEARVDAPRLQELTAELVRAVAADLPARGRVEIETAAAPGDGGPHSAVVAVRGNGRGVNAETVAHIFEPFVFDPAYDGGMRLPAIYATVVGSGGRITADSAPGAGTTIRLMLPQPMRRSGEQEVAG
jgi:two-component system cell cycle sensor histidine kinase/response regulator CckA